MRLTQERIHLLVEQGLTLYQARAYLALLEVPHLTAGALSKVSQVPRNRVYEVLEELQREGLVEILLEGEARQYRAKAIGPYLDRRIESLKQHIARIEEKRERLIAEFRHVEGEPSAELNVGVTSVVVGRRAVSQEVDRLLSEARSSVTVVASAGNVDALVQRLNSHADRFATEVKLDLFVSRTLAQAPFLARLLPVVRKAVAWIDLSLTSSSVFADESEMVLIQPFPDQGRLETGEDYALVSTNPTFVRDTLTLVKRSAQADVPSLHSAPTGPPAG